MFKTIRTLALVCAAGLSSMAMAAIQTLSKVDGVQQVKTSLEKREAVVTFDDQKTSVEKLSLASANAGYPATLKVVK